ncbi:hypothetical protein N7537_007529 [Penicillium hordei]|uniref:Uncharacterized protein n=1 Tax=Penicillium hordei TaxID=40994 RepID=A0AAD6DYZ6_9EURO|nr:uncharacterized protein N7537_007529 [Penicillium hordei]KAJ5597445.1 hypothetical protein N7537_007529 [Penicillium hordei]
MEGPASPGETPQNKKRNPSFRQMLRNQGLEIDPVVQGVRDPKLPPKRKRNQKHPGKKIAKKMKMAAAAAAAATTTNEASGPIVSAGSSVHGAGSSGASSPFRLTSRLPISPCLPLRLCYPPLVCPLRPPQLAAEETDADTVVWDRVDPLGLFDELEGPLDWLSEGLFD